MRPDFTMSARLLGITSAVGVVTLDLLYLGCLVAGLASLPSPQDPIADPWFTALELLILALMPFMVVLMVCVHAWAPTARKVQGLAAVGFMSLAALLTSAVHFTILTVSRKAGLGDMDWLFAFTWPSVAYAVDVLAWDFFFPIAVLFAAFVFSGTGLERGIRILLVTSGALAFAGLAGVFVNDMQIRNIGIVGYVIVFPVAAGSIGTLFWTAPRREG